MTDPQDISRVRDSNINVRLRASVSQRRSLLEKADLQRIGKMSIQLVDERALRQQLRTHGRIGKRKWTLLRRTLKSNVCFMMYFCKTFSV